MTTIGFRPSSNAFFNTKRVCGIGPSAASTSSRQPSAILSTRSTSPPKSAWPGVSMMLILTPLYITAVFLARIVMPRSRSRSFESMMSSPTCWLSRKTLLCLSRPSTSVVLPWSTCAMIATLRISRRTRVVVCVSVISIVCMGKRAVLYSIPATASQHHRGSTIITCAGTLALIVPYVARLLPGVAPAAPTLPALHRAHAHCLRRATYATVCGHKVPGMSWSPHRIPRRLCRARRPASAVRMHVRTGTSRMDNAHATSGRRVLIVDDGPDLIDLLTDGLQLVGGYEVVVAPDGANGIETFMQTRPDCVVVDVRMPGLNGYQFVRALRGDPATAQAPIGALSALAQDHDQLAGMLSGADAYLFKPVNMSDLTRTIERVMQLTAEQRSQQLRALAEQAVGDRGEP